MTTDVENLCLILDGISSPDNATRESAEKALDSGLASQPASYLLALCTVASSCPSSATPNGAPFPSPTNRSLAAIIFRRTVGRRLPAAAGSAGKTAGRLWTSLPPSTQVTCSEMILHGWSQERSNRDVRNKLGDAVAEVARLIIAEHDEWPQLLTLLWQDVDINSEAGGGNPGTGKEERAERAIAALRVLAAVPECVTKRQRGDLVARYLEQFLLPSASQVPPLLTAQIQLAALKALHLIVTSSGDDQKTAYSPLISHLPSLLTSLANAGLGSDGAGEEVEEVLKDVLLIITEMIDDCPKLFRSTCPVLLPILLAVIEGGNPPPSSAGAPKQRRFGRDVREAAVELLTTSIEVFPTAFRKRHREALKHILTLLLKIASEGLSDGPQWYAASPDDEADDEDGDDEELGEAFTLTAERTLDRICIALGGETVLPTLMAMIPPMLSSSDWRHRYAALRAIANIAEGCADLLEDRLEGLLSFVWPRFSDEHARVQYAACHALGQLCTDFSGTLQERFASQCLTCLVGVLTTSDQPRVQCHAAAALINFAEEVDEEAIAPVLETLLGRLVNLLHSSVLYLQEQVLATMAAFSSAAGKSSVRYMPEIMPLLLSCLQSNSNGNDSKFRLLQCRALEAITMIAVAVGKESFEPYAQTVVSLMVSLQQAELADDDQMIDYLASAWVRMCQVLGGADFAPFLPLILPRLLEAAAAEPDIAVIDAAAEPGAEAEYDPNEWEFATIKGRRLGIHTATLDAKGAAVESLAIYIANLGASFIPYLPATFERLLPLLHFGMHEGVQAAAAGALATLIKYQMTMDAGAAQRMAHQVLAAMLEELEKAGDAEVLVALLDSTAEILKVERPTSLTATDFCPPAFLSSAFVAINGLLTVISRHQSGGASDREAEAEEEEEDEEGDTSDDDEGIMYGITRLAAALFQNYREQTLPFAETLLQFCLKCIMSGRPPLFKHAAVCVLDDLVHWVGVHTAGIRDYVTQCFAKALVDADADTRQAAAFGIGMCSEHAPALYESFCIELLPALLGIIRHPDSKAPSVVTVTDNAMAAVARICTAYTAQGRIDLASVVPVWLAGLPVTHDEEEAPAVYGWLMALLGGGADPALVLGPNGERGPFVLAALRTALHQLSKLADPLRQQLVAASERLALQFPSPSS